MAGRKRKKVREKDVTGLKYFRQLAPLLERLHEDGCQRDKARNRELHFDQYCMLLLLYMFNPVVSSLVSVGKVAFAAIDPDFCGTNGPLSRTFFA